MHYRFLKSQILHLNDNSNRIVIPENTECCVVSDKIPEFIVLKILSPKCLSRFTVRLSRNLFDTLEKVTEFSPVYIQDKGDPDKVESIEVESQVIQPFRKKAIPEFILHEWYIIVNYKYPIIRFDGYDNGLYIASIPSRENNGIIKINIDENILRKYDIRRATTEELNKFCPNKQYSVIKTITPTKN